MNYKDYTIEIKKEKTSPNTWDINYVKLFKSDKEIFSFTRNYHAFTKDVIYFFERDGVDYMLFSETYVDISILNLQTLKSKPLKLYKHDKAKGDSSCGFCPVNIYVPNINDIVVDNYSDEKDKYLPLALVQGCVWGGDQGNYDLRILDLRDLDNIKYLDKQYHLSYSKRLDIRQDVLINYEPEDDRMNLTLDIPVSEYLDLFTI